MRVFLGYCSQYYRVFMCMCMVHVYYFGICFPSYIFFGTPFPASLCVVSCVSVSAHPHVAHHLTRTRVSLGNKKATPIRRSAVDPKTN